MPGASIAEAYVSIVPSFRGGRSAISGALGNAPEQAGAEGGRRFGGSFTSSFGGVAKNLIAVTGIGALGVGVGSILGAGLKRVTTIQNAQVSLTTILGSQKKAAEFTSAILKTVQGTPFNLDQFLNAGKNLVAFGLSAEKVPGILTAIGDAAAASGKGAAGVDQLATVFGQIQAKGKLQGDELLQLAEAGIPALTILSNKFGVSTGEMQKMISKGAVPAKAAIADLADGIENGTKGIAGQTPKLGGQMAALRNTFDGALGGFKASLARLGASVVGPLLDPMTKGLTALANGADFLTARAKPAFTSLLNVIEPTIGRAKDIITGLFTLFTTGNFKGSLGKALGVEEDSGVIDTLFNMADAGNKVIDVVGKIPTIVSGLFSLFTKGDYKGSLGKALGVDEDSSLIDNLFKIRDVVGSVFGAMQQIAGVAIKNFGALVVGLAPIVANLAGIFVSRVLPAIGAVASFIATNFVPTFVKLYTIISTNVVPIILSFANFLVSTVIPIVLDVAGKIGTALKPVFLAISDVLKKDVVPAVDQLLTKFREYQPQIQATIAVILKVVGVVLVLAAAILGKVLPPMIQFAGFLIRNLVPTIIAVITVIAKVVQGAIAIGTGVYNAGKAVVAFAKSVGDKIGSIVGYFTGLPGRISRATSGLFDGMKNAFRDAIDFIIRGWNGLQFSIHIPKVHIPGTNKDLGGGDINFGVPSIPELANGGIVPATPGGRLVRVAEAGQAEAVIPLNKAKQYGFGGGDRPIDVTIYEAADPDATAVKVGRRLSHALAAG